MPAKKHPKKQRLQSRQRQSARLIIVIRRLKRRCGLRWARRRSSERRSRLSPTVTIVPYLRLWTGTDRTLRANRAKRRSAQSSTSISHQSRLPRLSRRPRRQLARPCPKRRTLPTSSSGSAQPFLNWPARQSGYRSTCQRCRYSSTSGFPPRPSSRL